MATTAAAPVAFAAKTSPVTAAQLGKSWRAGCPVGPADLRMLRLSYWGFDERPHSGAIVVHKDVAADVTTVFRTLFAKHFPIRSLKPVSAYGGSDDDSMAADNTSAFNCRNAVSSGKPSWSVHAYGKAIDVNPVENPYLFGDEVLPPAGSAYVDRSRYRPGMAVKGGVLVKAFAAVGWKWNVGGANPDYQHFSTTGT
ncbi:M15 family metallopeptidase [Asanoa iriomotensis]|uniref:Peptidase M15C domain-containing protein n=1 Tax=Asanoa iriomotensis TaxID=234613 RepID=A0ABQ4BU12_9ACTN|nr:hypothetical protein Air01nite_01100 [Asanoa iriomotensis]